MSSRFWGRLRENLPCINVNSTSRNTATNVNIPHVETENRQNGRNISEQTTNMRDKEKNDYHEFKNKATELILKHPDDNFDLSLSYWLQDKQNHDLNRKYMV